MQCVLREGALIVCHDNHEREKTRNPTAYSSAPERPASDKQQGPRPDKRTECAGGET